MPGIATLHVYGIRRVDVVLAMGHMAIDRWRLRRADGLRFAKMLGTGSGRTFTLRDADLLHWARFAVWETPVAAVQYDTTDPWRRFATETLRFELVPLRYHGAWSRRDPFGPIAVDPEVDVNTTVGVATLTRARVRPRHWRTFVAATPAVAASVHDTPGLRFTIGIGEAPILRQGTFALWDSDDAIQQFAYGTAAHRNVMQRTKREHWYAEELFVRFAVRSIDGTLNGRAP